MRVSCSQCQPLQDFLQQGYVTVLSKYPEIINIIVNEAKLERLTQEQSTSFTVQFESTHQLQSTLEHIQHVLQEKLGGNPDLYASIQEKISETNPFYHLLSFSELRERVKNPSLVEVIKHSYFTNHIQPIISLNDQKVFAYEFLLRSSQEQYPFKPFELFSFAQKTGLQALLDANARKQAIQYSAENLSNGMLRFINFLPSSIYNPIHCLKSTFENIEKYRVNPADFVFEVVETEKIKDIKHLQTIFQAYKSEGMKVALDDVGAGYATVEVLQELLPDYAKIDRHMISYCDQSAEKQAELQRIVKVAKENNIKTLAEGIERKEELEFCHAIGMDLAQGYFIGKPGPNPL
ncbi:EAL domain-containing protein [Bacillus sp. BGMRC 2118]|nr:EAL domain-containing protein [Bacillus sp. BGMRC 2118]